MARGKKLLWYLVAIAITAAVVVAVIMIVNYINNLKYKPKANQNPQHFMTIHGKINPALIGNVRLKWVAVYASSDRRCDVTYNEFEGIVGWRTTDIPYVAKPSASGDYSFKIPLDYYQPGYCKWQIVEIDDNSGTQIKGGSTLVQFYPCGESAECIGGAGNVAPDPLVYSLKAGTYNICKYDAHQTLTCDMLSSSADFSSNGDIPRNHNYDFIETYDLSK